MDDLSALVAGGPIPAVNTGDLRTVREFMDRVRSENPEAKASKPPSAIGIDSKLLAELCGPGANVLAVFARSILLDVLVGQGVLAPWQRGARLDDAVFDVASTFPMPKFDQFDPDAFLLRLRNPSS